MERLIGTILVPVLIFFTKAILIASQAQQTRNGDFGLEYFVNGSWYTVCGDSFTSQAADVACIQMGIRRHFMIHILPRNPRPLLDISVCPNDPSRLCVDNGTIICRSSIFLQCEFQELPQFLRPTIIPSHLATTRRPGCLRVCRRSICRTICPNSGSSLSSGEIIGVIMGVLSFVGCCICPCFVGLIMYGNEKLQSRVPPSVRQRRNINRSRPTPSRQRGARMSDEELEVAAFDRQAQLNAVQNGNQSQPTVSAEPSTPYSFALKPVTPSSLSVAMPNGNTEQPSDSIQEDAPPEYNEASQYVTVTEQSQNSKLAEETPPSYEAAAQHKAENTEL